MSPKENLKNVLFEAKSNKKSLMAFNLQNLYQLEAIKAVTDEMRIPVIVQFSERYLVFLHEKFGLKYIMEKFGNNFIYFHLDHCINIERIKFCIDSGFDSVMYDGSGFPLKENIKNTLIVKEYADAKNCLVEGELGEVAGVEDGFGHGGSSYAQINEVEIFCRETSIDLMALGIGNAHGFYASLDGINLDIMKEAREVLGEDQLFVLHGGSGMPDDMIRKTINYGVVKINVSTQLKEDTSLAIKKYSEDNPLFNEIKFHKAITETLQGTFKGLIKKFTA